MIFRGQLDVQIGAISPNKKDQVTPVPPLLVLHGASVHQEH